MKGPLPQLLAAPVCLRRTINNSNKSNSTKSKNKRTNYFRNSFASAGAKLWNSIPASLKERILLNNLRLRLGYYTIYTSIIILVLLGKVHLI